MGFTCALDPSGSRYPDAYQQLLVALLVIGCWWDLPGWGGKGGGKVYKFKKVQHKDWYSEGFEDRGSLLYYNGHYCPLGNNILNMVSCGTDGVKMSGFDIPLFL